MRHFFALTAVVLAVLALNAQVVFAELDLEAPDDDTIAIADEVGVDALDLQGAMNVTRLDNRPYLISIGLLAPPVPPIFGQLARADCIIGKESGGLDVPNRQGSGASGPGQYFPGTWAYHTGLYRAATGYGGPLSLHSLADVRRVMAYVLTLPGQRAHWVVGGC